MSDLRLTDKQELFCKEYMIDLNATQAAIRAGYSGKTAGAIGTENLAKPAIQERLQELIKARSDKLQIDADWVLNSAKQVFDRCMQHEPVIVAGEPTGEYKFDSSGANKALDTIGKHVDVQAFNERKTTEVTHKVDETLASKLTGGSKR